MTPRSLRAARAVQFTGVRRRARSTGLLSARELGPGQVPLACQPREIVDLRRRQIGVEEVEDEDETRGIAVVPRRVEEGVVEHDTPSLALLDLVISNLELTSPRNSQRQLATKLGIGKPKVRGDAGMRSERREERGAEPGDAGDRTEQARGLRTQATGLLDLVAEIP
jgi:hypothetical protein